MKKNRIESKLQWMGVRRGTALLLIILTLFSSLTFTAALATSTTLKTIGDMVATYDKLTDSTAVKTYVKTSKATPVILGSDGVTTDTIPKDTYVQLINLQYYFDPNRGGGTNWTKVYYKGVQYFVCCEDIADDVLSAAALDSYVTGTLWTASSFTKLNTSTDARDIKVYGLQLALSTLGYTVTVDGSYGSGTETAVKKFQSDYELESDGFAGEMTQKKLYAAALAKISGSSSSSSSSSSTSVSAKDSIKPSSPKYYVTLTADTNIFTSDTKSTGTTVSKNTVLQLVANEYYTVDGVKYMCLYYNNKQYQVLASDLPSVMSASALEKYVTGTLWTASTFHSINSDTKYLGSVKVHGLQYALQLLGYYSGAMDGLFGEGTLSAVRNFQRSNSLAVDGRAGPQTQTALYKEALAAYKAGNTGDITYGSSGSSSSSSGSTGTVSSTGILTTTVSVNLRKGTSTSTTRMASIPANTVLTYTQTAISGGVTWFYVTYSGRSGWLMGTYVSAGSSSSSTSGSSGTLTIIKPGTHIRKTPNGAKSGQSLGLNSSVVFYSTSSAGGYTWYYIQSPSGLYGYVRGDCANVTSSSGGSTGGGSGTTTGTIPTSSKTYAKLLKDINVFTTNEVPTTGLTKISAGTVVQLVSTQTETRNGKVYCSIYFQNKSYNAVFTDLEESILSPERLLAYIVDDFWKVSYSSSLKESSGLKGDVRVEGAQLALSVLGYYSGSLDGNFGSSTTTAVKNFQRKNGLDVDGSIGPKTWVKLFPMARTAYTAGSWSSSGDSGVSSSDFGTVNTVEIGTWAAINNSSGFPKSSTAQVYDIDSKKVFTIYRWAGGNHADCFPRTAADTAIMCDIVGFPYNSSHPTSTQLAQIKADSKADNPNYLWPDFNGKLTGAKSIGNAWQYRAALLNVSGRVFAVSIYGWPHGMESMTSAKLDGKAPYLVNNYYGMMCVHFLGSTGHSDTSPQRSERIKNINDAYAAAKTLFKNATFKSN